MLLNGEHVDIGSLGGLAELSLNDQEDNKGQMPVQGISKRSRNLLG